MSEQDGNDEFNFEDQLIEADWSMLEPHHKRGGLFVIAQELDLKEVARSVANDEIEKVKEWLEKGDFRHPTEAEIETWSADNYRKFAIFVIVQPYVLIQKLGH